MKTVLIICRDVLALHAMLFCPFLFAPKMYLLLMALLAACGLPAIPLFYLVITIARKLCTRYKYGQWTAILICLPAIWTITALCASLAAHFVIGWLTGTYTYSLWYCLFGVLALIQATATILEKSKDIHRFIYPDLYADNFKKDTSQFPGMVDT